MNKLDYSIELHFVILFYKNKSKLKNRQNSLNFFLLPFPVHLHINRLKIILLPKLSILLLKERGITLNFRCQPNIYLHKVKDTRKPLSGTRPAVCGRRAGRCLYLSAFNDVAQLFTHTHTHTLYCYAFYYHT